MFLNGFRKDWQMSAGIPPEPQDNTLFEGVKTTALDIILALVSALSPSPRITGSDSDHSWAIL